ncbi:transcription factor TGA1-like isoform X2 [Asparagus officinalis]|uniref:transcription factor TGA1-like isoform X2 n=1 Tax=Asparagus officinalis TaxID=4686 RepID=UPI00098E6CDF|nr:transcription factor TGA1-like isoform X2 [Asparagus officinalis]
MQAILLCDKMELYGYFEENFHHLNPNSISSASAQFATSRAMGIYEANHHNSIWGNSFKVDSGMNTGAPAVVEANPKLNNRLEDIPSDALEQVEPSKRYDQEANKPADKVSRRLAQNREAARKSRLRKKAYVQQLETSRIKLAQIEQELERARQQGVYVSTHAGDSSLGLSGAANSGIAAFEMQYGHWVDKQNTQISELRAALLAHVSEIELRMLVERGMEHYDELFHIKAIAAKSDVFYLMSGMWRTSAERFFLWIGGFRPSELLKILIPQLEPLTEQQVVAVCNLQQSSRQAEDAYSQGMDKLQQTLTESLTSEPLGSGVANYIGQMANAMGNMEAFISFATQADHLRQQTLQRMSKILTTRQAARGLLALGDYCQRLRALSSVWAARPREPA